MNENKRSQFQVSISSTLNARLFRTNVFFYLRFGFERIFVRKIPGNLRFCTFCSTFMFNLNQRCPTEFLRSPQLWQINRSILHIFRHRKRIASVICSRVLANITSIAIFSIKLSFEMIIIWKDLNLCSV